MPPLRKPSSIGRGKPSTPTKPTSKPAPPPIVPVVKAASPKPFVKPAPPPKPIDTEAMKQAHREADRGSVARWADELVKRFNLTFGDGTELVAIGVCMSQHERAVLLRLLDPNRK